MSDMLLLKGLLLQERGTVNYSSSVKSKQDNKQEDQTEYTSKVLSRLDSLLLSSNTSSAKGSVPINLLSPDQINSKAEVNKTQSRGLARLNGLISNPQSTNVQGGVKDKKQSDSVKTTQNVNNVTTNHHLKPLNVSSASFVSTYSVSNNSTSVTGKLSISSFDFVETADQTNEKLSLAIEAIKNWDSKVKTLDSLFNTSKNNSSVASTKGFQNALINGSEQLSMARTEAIMARKEAITAYNDALKEYLSMGIKNSKSDVYKAQYDQMEKMFGITKQKDESIMAQVAGFLKTSFNYALVYGNPFNY